MVAPSITDQSIEEYELWNVSYWVSPQVIFSTKHFPTMNTIVRFFTFSRVSYWMSPQVIFLTKHFSTMNTLVRFFDSLRWILQNFRAAGLDLSLGLHLFSDFFTKNRKKFWNNLSDSLSWFLPDFRTRGGLISSGLQNCWLGFHLGLDVSSHLKEMLGVWFPSRIWLGVLDILGGTWPAPPSPTCFISFNLTFHFQCCSSEKRFTGWMLVN